MSNIKRRDFITLIGGAAGWPLVARAQQPRVPVIGFLSFRSSGESASAVAAFRKGLGEAGYTEGQNLAIEFRWADGQYDRLQALAADLVRRQVAVIAATGGPASGQTAKAATSTIPIVFVSGADPVQEGLVASLNRPGGNATGVNPLLPAMEGKRLGFLREVVPNAALVGVLANPVAPFVDRQVNDIQETARRVGQQVHILRVSSDENIEAAFATMTELKVGALQVCADPFMLSRRERLVTLAARYAIPAIYAVREYATAGGLMSYGISLADVYRTVGLYTGRILNGERPAELPVVQPTKFELVINVKTAKALGVKISDDLLSLSDEVIE